MNAYPTDRVSEFIFRRRCRRRRHPYRRRITHGLWEPIIISPSKRRLRKAGAYNAVAVSFESYTNLPIGSVNVPRVDDTANIALRKSQTLA